MKKLMIATAAVVAGMTVFAVESGNIVGYLNKSNFTPGDAEMAAPMFLTTGGASVRLSDLSVGGYTTIADEGEGCEGGVKITMLNRNGVTASSTVAGQKKLKNYTWYDLGEDLPAGWYDDDVGLMADADTCEALGQSQSYWGDAADITFNPGEGFRLTEDSSFSDLTLNCAGEVKQTATFFNAFVPGDATAMGNPTPKLIKLSQISVGGYTTVEDEGEGCEGGIKITILNRNGVTASATIAGQKKLKNYTWYDLGEDLPAGWYDDDVGLMADADTCEALGQTQSYWGDAADITFNPGDGFRVTEDSSFNGLVLKFPSPMN